MSEQAVTHENVSIDMLKYLFESAPLDATLSKDVDIKIDQEKIFLD